VAFAVMVGLWVVYGGLWWISGGGIAVSIFFFFFFFSFYVAPNTVKYFSDYFPKCKQTRKKQTFSCKSFVFANILR
jgi:hypothetical protein